MLIALSNKSDYTYIPFLDTVTGVVSSVNYSEISSDVVNYRYGVYCPIPSFVCETLDFGYIRSSCLVYGRGYMFDVSLGNYLNGISIDSVSLIYLQFNMGSIMLHPNGEFYLGNPKFKCMGKGSIGVLMRQLSME